jgi:hypothetical protein
MSLLPKDETPFDYHFVDDNQTIVEVRYQRPENHLEGFIIRMDDPTNDDYIRLMEITSLEELQRLHEENKKAKKLYQEQVMNHEMLHDEINRLRQLLTDAGTSKDNWKKKALTVKGGAGRTSRERVVYKDQDIMEVLTKELNREDLFALKISIFEQPKVRGSQDKEVKSKIRKAKSTLEVLAAAAPLLLAEDQEENSE